MNTSLGVSFGTLGLICVLIILFTCWYRKTREGPDDDIFPEINQAFDQENIEMEDQLLDQLPPIAEHSTSEEEVMNPPVTIRAKRKKKLLCGKMIIS